MNPTELQTQLQSQLQEALDGLEAIQQALTTEPLVELAQAPADEA